MHLFSPKLFHALQLRRLKQWVEGLLVHSRTVAQNHIFAAHALELRCRLTVRLKHPLEEILHFEIVGVKPVAQLRGADQIENNKRTGTGVLEAPQ